MRSSFYSMSLLNDDEGAAAVDENVQASRQFKEQQAKRGSVIDQLNITNILELS